MSEVEDRALERIEVRRGDRPPPAVTIEPPGGGEGPDLAAGSGSGDAGAVAREPLLPPPGSAAFMPGGGGATAERLARALVADPIEAIAGTVRAAGAMAEAAFNPANMLDDLQGALQNVSPVLMNRAIEEGAVQPLGSVNDVVQGDDGGQYLGGQRLDPDQVVVWRGEVYPRRFVDPAGTGRTFDFSQPAPADSTMDPTVSATRDVTDVGADRGWLANAATRLGRLFMAVMPDPLGGSGQVANVGRELARPTIGMAARSGAGAVDATGAAIRPASEMVDWWRANAQGKSKGEAVPHAVFSVGDISAPAMALLARYAPTFADAPPRVFVSGRVIKHADEQRSEQVARLLPDLPRLVAETQMVLPNPTRADPWDRPWLVIGPPDDVALVVEVRDTAFGIEVVNLISPVERTRVRKALDRARELGLSEYDLRIARPEGRTAPSSSSAPEGASRGLRLSDGRPGNSNIAPRAPGNNDGD